MEHQFICWSKYIFVHFLCHQWLFLLIVCSVICHWTLWLFFFGGFKVSKFRVFTYSKIEWWNCTQQIIQDLDLTWPSIFVCSSFILLLMFVLLYPPCIHGLISSYLTKCIQVCMSISLSMPFTDNSTFSIIPNCFCY